MLNGSPGKGSIVTAACSVLKYLDKIKKPTRGYNIIVDRNSIESMRYHIPIFAHLVDFQLLCLQQLNSRSPSWYGINRSSNFTHDIPWKNYRTIRIRYVSNSVLHQLHILMERWADPGPTLFSLQDVIPRGGLKLISVTCLRFGSMEIPPCKWAEVRHKPHS